MKKTILFFVLILALLSNSCFSTTNHYLADRLKRSSPNSVKVFLVNATRYCKNKGGDPQICLKKMDQKLIIKLFDKEKKVNYVGCLSNGTFCTPWNGPCCGTCLAFLGVGGVCV